MKTKFCPLCRSVMKNGVCTNLKCGNTQLEIDFNNFLSKLNKFSPDAIRSINNSYIKGIELFEDDMTFSKGLVSVPDNLEISLPILKPLIENKLDVNVKLANFMRSEDRTKNLDYINVQTMKYYSIKEARIMPVKKYKHYIEFSLETTMGGFGRKKNVPLAHIWGSNDLIKWHKAGLNSLENIDFNKWSYLISIALAKNIMWSLKIKDNKTGLSVKTFFTKDRAYELFKDREIKNGKKRRTALKHIVDDYERHIPKDAMIKEHFRGDMVFQWRGITFTLSPSNIDLERIFIKRNF